MNKIKEIAIFSDGIAPFTTGGMQTHTKDIIENFSFFVNTIYVYVSYTDLVINEKQVLNLFKEEIRNKLKVSIIKRPKSWLPQPFKYLHQEWLLSKAMFKQWHLTKPLIIYAQGLTGWAKTGNNIVLTNLHGYEFAQPTIGIKAKLQAIYIGYFLKKCLKKADYAISLGGQITTIIEKIGIPKPRILEHRNSANTSNFVLKNTPNKQQFLFVGRNEARKGLNLLLEAWNKKDWEGELTIIGDIPKKEEIKNANFLGEIKDKEKLQREYEKADFIVLPSLSEGMPMVLLEACSFGCVPICTNVGAISSYFNNTNALICETGNTSSLFNNLKFASSLQESELLKLRENSISTLEKNNKNTCTSNFFNELHSVLYKTQ